MLLSIYEFRENRHRESRTLLWANCNYVHMYTVKKYYILEVKNALVQSVPRHGVRRYAVPFCEAPRHGGITRVV
jgi:hypothetical protein